MKRVIAAVLLAAACVAGSTSGYAQRGGSARGAPRAQDPTTLLGSPAPQPRPGMVSLTDAQNCGSSWRATPAGRGGTSLSRPGSNSGGNDRLDSHIAIP
jgi:hypothetical protein